MAHYDDLSPCGDFPWPGITAVGWLEAGSDYPQGAVSDEFLEALIQLLNFPGFPSRPLDGTTAACARAMPSRVSKT